MLQLTPQAIRIVDSYPDGEDAMHYRFEPINFKFEQKVQVGQFFMLSVAGAGSAPFTYVGLPDSSGQFAALIRKVGKLTAALFELKQGDVVGYNGPFGQAWPINDLLNKEVLIVAGGCGLAPLAAVVDELISRGQASTTTVVYGAKNSISQVLKQERLNWNKHLRVHECLLQGTSFETLGNPVELVAKLFAQQEQKPQVVLTCGPEGMMRAVAETCHSLSIQTDNIWLSLEKRMRCGVGLCGHCYLANELVCKDGPTYRFDKLMGLEQKLTADKGEAGLYHYC